MADEHQLWAVVHPAKSFGITCMLAGEAPQLRLVAGVYSEVLAEVFATREARDHRAEVLLQRLLARGWRIVPPSR